MVVTNDPEVAELLRVLRAHGWTRALKNRQAKEAEYPDLDPRFLFINTGFNLRPTELQAAMGIVQLGKLESFNQRRVEIASHWNHAFEGLIAAGRIRPMKPTAETDCTWFGYPVICENRECREGLKNHLEANGVETRPVIAGNLLRQPAFRHIPHRVVSRTSEGHLPGADEVSDRGLYWGSHPTMTEQEVEYVAQTVRSFFQ
jgi:CDP-6-deoxy-D-xylo-4-hexulose-3-dehydrase